MDGTPQTRFKTLTEIFRGGRFKKEPTLWIMPWAISLGIRDGMFHYEVGADYRDMSEKRERACSLNDVRMLLKVAEQENDTPTSNPNLKVVHAALNEMNYLGTPMKPIMSKPDVQSPQKTQGLAPVIPLRPSNAGVSPAAPK